MIPNATLELSIEQLIGALNKRLFIECARLQAAMPPTSRVQIAALTDEVDALEKRAKDVLHEVISLRNSLRPVNRLPPEVLTSCVTHVSDSDPRLVIPLTHVCRYWRKAIASNPRNWVSISGEWKRLVPLCLERSRAVPLTVDITVSEVKNDNGLLQLLPPHTSRIGCLRLVGYSSIETVGNDLPGFFDLPMPNLTSLELQQTEEPTELFPPNNAPVPSVIGNVSNLGSLSLTRTPIYPALFSIASLREMKLLGYARPFNFKAFLRLLRSNPHLEGLSLDVQFIPNTVCTLHGNARIPLSCLRRLSIACSKPIDSKGLLSCISLSRGIQIEVTFTSDQSLDIGLFIPSPKAPIQELLDPITAIKTRLAPRELQVIGGSSSFTFRAPRGPALKGHTDFMLFPPANTREFHANIQPLRYTPDGMSATMAQFPALEILAISETKFPDGLLSALTAEPVLCPALKTIAFLDCDIDSDIVGKLAGAIGDRRDRTGARLYRVVIVNSTATQLDAVTVQKLRKSVPCVEIRVDDKFPDLS